MKELDLLLTRYLAEHWDDASAAEKASFESFLDLPDPVIASYLLAHETAATPAFETLVVTLRGCVRPIAARSGR
jgi:succinate dehydrogenase flavin-adding protein (antitoxin of CptAB toxin-antitoxin module)